MRRPGWLAAACVIAATVMTAAAQLPVLGRIDPRTGVVGNQVSLERPRGSIARAVAWVNAILAHRPGTADAAAQGVAAWSRADVGNLLIELETLRGLFKAPQRKAFPLPYEAGKPPRTTISYTQTQLRYSDDDLVQLRRAVQTVQAAGMTDTDLIARAVVLHGDIRFELDRPGPSLQHTDGVAGAYRDDTDHLKVARYLTERLRSEDSRDDDIRAWYRATLATLIGIQSWNADHLQQALERFGDDGELRFLSGCLHELMAAPRSQEPLRDFDLPPNLNFRVGSAREELGEAVNDFRRALHADGRHAQARLHYGRVLVMIGRPLEAIPDLRRAATELRAPDQQYFAQLFLGLAYENSRQPAAARAAYQAAAALVPVAQAPRLALSQLAAAAGDRRTGGEEIARLFALPAAEVDRVDPWWDYLTSCGAGAGDLMTEAGARLSAPRRARR